MTFDNQTPSIKVEVENSKLDMQKKDGVRILKVAQQSEFKSILEAKVDINVKIARLLTNAINWKFDFQGSKGSKFAFTFPVQAE